nr:VOC family protein [uncultured Agathobaculum sp.]
MKYKLPVLAVRDVEISKQFYHDLFDQQVTADFGQCVTFSGGFAIQQGFDALVGIPKSSVLYQSNNMQLYFEVEDFDTFADKLYGFLDVELVHPPKTYAWHQRAVCLYDPDWHMIEVGESMAVVVKRLLRAGNTVEQSAQMTQMPINFVEQCKKGMEQI